MPHSEGHRYLSFNSGGFESQTDKNPCYEIHLSRSDLIQKYKCTMAGHADKQSLHWFTAKFGGRRQFGFDHANGK